MTRLAENKHTSNFPRSGRPWLEQLRQQGIDRFDEVGFPSTKQEEWRFTNVAPIAKIPFKHVPENPDTNTAKKLRDAYTFGREAARELVFVNGEYSPALSSNSDSLSITAGDLATAFRQDADRIQHHLGRHADIRQNPFVALNTGFLRDGAYVHLSRGAAIRQPIHLLFLSVPGPEPTVSHPRVLVIADENAEATIVETYAGAEGATYFTNAVTEIIAGPSARIDHCKLQQESLAAFHVTTTQVDLDRSATFISHSASLGSRLTRNDLIVVMNGEHADATLNGLVIIGGEQHVDNHTLLRHEKPNCPSHELYKHVLDGKSTGVFKGKIFVQKDAQKTDSKQTSKSLLLSDDAMMESMPALEIYADDVKCTHGSTIGPLDEDMVFYLRTRGISLEAARHLLTYAFAADVTRRIKVEPVRRRLEDFMAAQHGLPQDLRITDLGTHDQKAM